MSRDLRDAELRGADADARRGAQREFAAPVVMEAGAGTGKTAALVARAVAWCLGPGWDGAATEARAQARPTGTGGEEAVAARVLEGVVAITFTEAAAAEMADRLAAALAGLAGGAVPVGIAADELAIAGPERASRARALLVALDRLQVGTIHAFCRRLLARFPLEAGLHPAFVVDADGSLREEVARDVVEARVRRALAGTPEASLVALAAAGLGPAELAAAVAALLEQAVAADALDADPFGPAAVDALRGELIAALVAFEEAGGGRLAGVRRKNAVAPRVVATLRELAEVAARSEAGVAGLDAVCARVRAARLDEAVERLEMWAGGELKDGEDTALGDAAEAAGVAAGRLAAAMKRLRPLQPVLFGHARSVLAGLLAEARRELARRGAVSFQALLRDARDLLCTHDEIASRLRGETRQLLVDEFQDTDPAQCDLLRALALSGERRPGLFLVGDPKQSIYGWREADLESYERFVRAIEAVHAPRGRLSVNFRSAPAILAEVERCIAPAMIEELGVQPPFQRLVPCPAKETAGGFRRGRWAPVEYWVCWRRPDDGEKGAPRTVVADAEEREAAWLARDVRALHDEEGVPWSEVGVLLRTFGGVETVLRAMREAGVPYAVERDRSYYRRREVVEAAALVRTILDPGDHLAAVTWLRSAQVGVPDAALLDLWLGGLPGLLTELAGPGAASLDAVRALASSVAAGPPADIPGLEDVRGWEASFVAAVTRLAELRAAFRTDSAAAFVERVRLASLVEATEAARFLGAWRVANLDRFFRQLEAALEAAGGDVAEVLRALRRAVAEGREAEEGKPREAAADAVRVLTVHKAKGLDFTHVYLLQAHKKPREGSVPRTEAARLPGGAAELRLFGVPSPGWADVEARRGRVADAERARTLYVAMTRAKERVVVSGNWSPGSGSLRGSHLELLQRSRADGDTLAALLDRAVAAGEWAVDADGARWVFPALAPAEDAGIVHSAEVELPPVATIEKDAARLAALGAGSAARMKRRFGGPASAEAHRLLRERLDEAESSIPARHSGGGATGAATLAGSAVHAVLERIELDGDLSAALRAERGRLGYRLDPRLPEKLRAAAVHRAEGSLDRFASSPLWRRLVAIAPHVVARELPVLLPPAEGAGPVGFVAGTVDLLYRDGDAGELVVADYKTDEVEGDALAERARSYASQGLVYVRAVQEALALPAPPRFELWFLHAGVVREA